MPIIVYREYKGKPFVATLKVLVRSNQYYSDNEYHYDAIVEFKAKIKTDTETVSLGDIYPYDAALFQELSERHDSKKLVETQLAETLKKLEAL